MKICDTCETVIHCTKHGCIPKVSAKDSAMRLALEALEQERENYQNWDKEDGAPEYIHEAITALREALAEQPAQPAQEFVCSTGLCHYKTQRTWQGLTDEERQEIWKGCDPTHAGYVTALVEAKLRRKNEDSN